jgi:hypothetical protein
VAIYRIITSVLFIETEFVDSHRFAAMHSIVEKIAIVFLAAVFQILASK